MRRATGFLLHNWPLKIGAILLATLLYSGLVLAQSVRVWTGVVPVDIDRPAAGAVLLSALEPVTRINYRAPLDVGVLSPDSFRASVDLSRVEAQPGGRPQPVPVTLFALDSRVVIVDYEPRLLQVQLDPVSEREMEVTVVTGTVPEGLSTGVERADPPRVTVRGASSRVEAVQAVVARVTIDASALNVDQEVDLLAVDADGNQVPNVVVEPARVHVTIPVARELASRTLPVAPQFIGAPAQGYRVASVEHTPLTVTVSGEATTVTQMLAAETQPIDLSDRTTDLEATIALALPDQVTVNGTQLVRVLVRIEEQTGSRTFQVGIRLAGTRTDLNYNLLDDRVTIVLGGPEALLADTTGAQMVARADVAELEPGEHLVRVTFTAPLGLEVVDTDPVEVRLLIEPSTPEE
ncbi:MAG TPA: CdaR family protein [Candidatus Limnocylindria bacterium]|nr:CdaR family protein [Candidatus Limnocylindria bacterium]